MVRRTGLTAGGEQNQQPCGRRLISEGPTRASQEGGSGDGLERVLQAKGKLDPGERSSPLAQRLWRPDSVAVRRRSSRIPLAADLVAVGTGNHPNFHDPP